MTDLEVKVGLDQVHQAALQTQHRRQPSQEGRKGPTTFSEVSKEKAQNTTAAHTAAYTAGRVGTTEQQVERHIKSQQTVATTQA